MLSYVNICSKKDSEQNKDINKKCMISFPILTGIFSLLIFLGSFRNLIRGKEICRIFRINENSGFQGFPLYLLKNLIIIIKI